MNSDNTASAPGSESANGSLGPSGQSQSYGPGVGSVPQQSTGVPQSGSYVSSPVVSSMEPQPVPPTIGQPTIPTPPVQQGSPTPPANASVGKKLLLILLILFVLAALGTGGYFGYRALKHHDQTTAVKKALTTSSSQQTAGAIDISTLNDIKFNIPSSALEGLTLQEGGNPDAKGYYTSDRECFVVFGTGTAAQLPGGNITEIVNDYLDGVRQAGATVSTPTAAEARKLKDTNDPNKQYSIPSLNLAFSQDTEQAAGYFSGALLKSGRRVIIETACHNKGGAVDASRMAAMESVVKHLTITPQ